MTNQSNTDIAQNSPQRAAVLGLSVSAVVLAALVLVQATGLLSSPAHASAAVSSEGYSAATVAAGSSVEVLMVIDDRTETLYIYGERSARQIDLLERQSLPELFSTARAAALGD
ncbi:MAG: hypothetical protein AAFR38_00150 [Planctomycetota bacterium]